MGARRPASRERPSEEAGLKLDLGASGAWGSGWQVCQKQEEGKEAPASQPQGRCNTAARPLSTLACTLPSLGLASKPQLV